MFSVLLSSNKFARLATSPVLRSQLLCPAILESYPRKNQRASHLKASWTVKKTGGCRAFTHEPVRCGACHSLVLGLQWSKSDARSMGECQPALLSPCGADPVFVLAIALPDHYVRNSVLPVASVN